MENNSELYHYGVLGMKWGVRRNPSKAYAKATAKKKKLEDKVETARVDYRDAAIKTGNRVSRKHAKFQAKADKFQYKADKKSRGLFKNEKKAVKYQLKSNKYQRKADKRKAKVESLLAAEADTKVKYLKAQKKAEKWANRMDKAFANIPVSELAG